MIDNDLDLEHWRTTLRTQSRVQIPDFLQPEAAEALANELAERVPWQFAERSGGVSRVSARGDYPDDAAYRRALERSYDEADSGYRFAYDSYMLVKAAKEGWDRALAVNRLLPFFNSPEFLAFVRHLTGESSITRINGQCTRYRRGHFLMPHDDQDTQEGRRYAYVINLSRDWRPEWGGQLQFLGTDDAVTQTFLPRWNSLSLFRVPQRHQVTLVAPWAARARHAITGWWLVR
jgi:SM-20-related protein